LREVPRAVPAPRQSFCDRFQSIVCGFFGSCTIVGVAGYIFDAEAKNNALRQQVIYLEEINKRNEDAALNVLFTGIILAVGYFILR